MDIVSITTPNHLHAGQAVAAARAGKHFVLEKPTALDTRELARIRDAVRKAKVRTIVSFELHYNPYLRFVHWLRASGRLGRIRFARVQYLSRVTDWYSGWDWVRKKSSGGSHLLAAGCHAVDALRWCSGLEPVEVSAFHTRFTEGYEWPTTIAANMKLQKGAIGHVTSSTDFMLPYTFGVELMGDKATVRDTLVTWHKDQPLDVDELRRANPFPEVKLARRAVRQRQSGPPDRLPDAGQRRREPPSVPGRDRRAGGGGAHAARDAPERVRCPEDDGGLPGRGPLGPEGGQARAPAPGRAAITSRTPEEIMNMSRFAPALAAAALLATAYPAAAQAPRATPRAPGARIRPAHHHVRRASRRLRARRGRAWPPSGPRPGTSSSAWP